MSEILTQNKYDTLRSFGCDPTCHVCGKPLVVGDRFAIVKLDTPGLVGKSLVVSGSVCAPCAIGRETKPSALTAAIANASMTEVNLRNLVLDRAGSTSRHNGCLFDEHGQVVAP